MRSRRLALPLALVALLAPAAGTAHADDRVIAPGVKAGGVDVGGQTVDTAAATLDLALRRRAERAVVVKVAGRSFRLEATDAKAVLDAVRTAKRAYYAGRDKGPNSEVPLALSHSRKAVETFAAKVDRSVSRAPRNSTLRMTIKRMFVRRSREGRTINERILADRISAAYDDPNRKREMTTRLRADKPAINANDIRRRNRTVLTVDRDGRKLRLFKNLRHSKTYGIAIGAAGFDTPSGRFRIQSKQVNPAWHVPNSAWAGSLAGQTIPGGAPNNPLKARWLGVNGSVGIHGTAEEWSIGSRASRGCIRMRVRDVIELYRRVPVGAAVLIR